MAMAWRGVAWRAVDRIAGEAVRRTTSQVERQHRLAVSRAVHMK